jgi:hypothetical protein
VGTDADISDFCNFFFHFSITFLKVSFVVLIRLNTRMVIKTISCFKIQVLKQLMKNPASERRNRMRD